MASAVPWLDALKRLKRRAFQRSDRKRIPILACGPNPPLGSWQHPELRVIERERQVEFALHVTGAKAESTQVYWSEEDRTLTVHALADCGEPLADGVTASRSARLGWHAQIPVDRDVDVCRAKAFLEHGTLRVVAPRVDSTPLTGLPLLVWTDTPSTALLAT